MNLLYVCAGEYPSVFTTPAECDALIERIAEAIKGQHGETADNIGCALDMCGLFIGFHDHGAFAIVDLAHPSLAKIVTAVHRTDQPGEALSRYLAEHPGRAFQ